MLIIILDDLHSFLLICFDQGVIRFEVFDSFEENNDKVVE